MLTSFTIVLQEQISDSQSSDEDWEPEAEATAMDVAGTTGLSDSETDQSCDYSDDMDAMYDDQIPARTNDGEEAVAGGGVKAHDIIESSTTFPSLSSTNRMFLMKIPGDTSAKEFSLFRTNRLRRTGELELQLELKAGATSNDIEVGLERCMVGGGGHAGAIDPIRDSCCTFLASGAVFNYFKRNALVNINYPQDKALLSQGVSRIGLKITRDGALEFFVNGQSLGVAAEAVYKLGLWRLYHVTGMINYYPVLWLPTRCTTTLIAGGNYVYYYAHGRSLQLLPPLQSRALATIYL